MIVRAQLKLSQMNTLQKKVNFLLKSTSYVMLSSALVFSSCKKQQEVDGQNLSGSGKHNLNNVLNITKGQLEQLKTNYIKTKKVYANQFGAIKSLANATATMEPNAANYQMAVDEMVSDELLTSVLNDQGEIIVDNSLYRVTPFGTFQTTPENQASLDLLINEINQSYPVTALDLDNPAYDLSQFYQSPGQIASPDEVITLRDGIGFIPTFSRDHMVLEQPLPVDMFYGVDPGTVLPFDYTNYYNGVPINNGDPGLSPPPPYQAPIANTPEPSIVDEKDLPSAGANPFNHVLFNDANMGTKNMTNANGSFWKTIFQNATEYNNFDSKYRTSVLFYNRNYIFTKSLGIKVKHQKKGWLWWNKADAPVIAAGWEYIAYGKQESKVLRNYYSTIIPKGTIVGTGSGKFDYSVIPTKVEILKTTSIMGDSYIPLIIGNDLPIPETVRVKGIQAVIDYVWKIVQKKIKTGDAILKENNASHPVDPAQSVGEWKTKALIVRDYKTNSNYFIFPPYMQFAYNTDMIDIPLDNYTADFVSAIPIVASALTNPQEAVKALGDWAKDELGSSFQVKQAVVFGSSQKDGQWRGIRVISGDDTGYAGN